MKKSRILNRQDITLLLVGWFAATNLLMWPAHATGWWPFIVLLFLCLSFLPGVAILRTLGISFAVFTSSVVYSFGLSMLTLMLSGLAANQILFGLGVSRPLSVLGCIGAWDIVTALLILASYMCNHKDIRLKRWRINKLSWLLLGLSALLPIMAALGAFRLNNGGDGLFAELTLGMAALLLLYVFLLRRRLTDGVLAWFIFTLGLTVLLMTALRGWDIIGHDIEREFRVFTLTQLHGHWDIGLDREPYNACLSITILPHMLAQILGVSGLIVFKVILQIIFAVCPVVLFILLRQYVSRLGALVGSVLFICYPTFINDSAMLTRQGVAYLFFALALMVISNKTRKRRYKLLFLLCALGAVLSHYSTAYMFVALFAVAVGCKLGITWWQNRRKPKRRAPNTVLSPLFAVLIFLMTFAWYTQITATSDGLAVTIKMSLANIPKFFSADNKSADTSSALLFSGGKSLADLYQTYLTNSQATRNIASQIQFLPTLTSDDLPVTPLGEKARAIGLNPTIIYTLRQNFAKVLQLLAVASVIFVTYKWLRKKSKDLEPDYICLNIAGILLLALMVALPVLSINYGILRAFQQGLIFLILPMTLLLARIGRRLNTRLTTITVSAGLIMLFLLFSGLLAQLLGGTSPSLTMNNSGLYYGLFYTNQADAQAFAWLKTHIPKTGDVRTANVNRALMHDPAFPFLRAGILPSQISPNTFVYMDETQKLSHMFYIYYESSPLIMTFPVDYYETTKDQIYSSTSTAVYR